MGPTNLPHTGYPWCHLLAETRTPPKGVPNPDTVFGGFTSHYPLHHASCSPTLVVHETG